jgi:hypothetical protein
MHKLIAINRPEDVEQLASSVPAVFIPKLVINRLRGQISAQVKNILVEYPYIDKDYRSTYYAFYAKKGLRYDPFTARLHFFGDGVILTDDLELRWTGRDRLDELYFGYMVLRPTGITPIGRTVLSVRAKDDFAGALIEAN